MKYAFVPLGSVFFVAGVLKVLDPLAFARQVAGYDLLPTGLVSLAAATLPWIEIVGALALIRWRDAGALVLLSLTALFFVASVQALVRGLDPLCGCFGAASGRVGIASFAIEAACGACAVLTLRKASNDSLKPHA